MKTKLFYQATERDDYGNIVKSDKPVYEVRISGKIDNDGNDYTEEEDGAMVVLCNMLNENGFRNAVIESGAVWCSLNRDCGIANEKEDFKSIYNEWKNLYC